MNTSTTNVTAPRAIVMTKTSLRLFGQSVRHALQQKAVLIFKEDALAFTVELPVHSSPNEGVHALSKSFFAQKTWSQVLNILKSRDEFEIMNHAYVEVVLRKVEVPVNFEDVSIKPKAAPAANKVSNGARNDNGNFSKGTTMSQQYVKGSHNRAATAKNYVVPADRISPEGFKRGTEVEFKPEALQSSVTVFKKAELNKKFIVISVFQPNVTASGKCEVTLRDLDGDCYGYVPSEFLCEFGKRPAAAPSVVAPE